MKAVPDVSVIIVVTRKAQPGSRTAPAETQRHDAHVIGGYVRLLRPLLELPDDLVRLVELARPPVGVGQVGGHTRVTARPVEAAPEGIDGFVQHSVL